MENLYKYNLTVFTHKILATSIPHYLREKLIFRHDMHNSNLRFADKLALPQYHTAMFQRSFTYNSVTLYNSLPSRLKNLPVNSFRKNAKAYFLYHQ